MICKFTFKKKDFFRFLRDAVKYYPNQEGEYKDVFCKRLNSFVIPDQIEDFRLDNFGIDLDKVRLKDFFFQREKVEYKYPALLVSEPSDPYRVNNKETCTFEIGVIDKQVTDCSSNCGYCHNRTIHEIKCDLSEMLDRVFEYLRTIVSYRSYTLDNKGNKVYNSDEHEWESTIVLDEMISDGLIVGYDKYFVNTKRLQSQFIIRDRLDMKYTQFVGDFHSVYYTPIKIEVDVACLDPMDWNTKAKDMKIEDC